MPPGYVKPYVKRQKNDAADAEASGMLQCQCSCHNKFHVAFPLINSCRARLFVE
jgi:hypothetical protein